MAEKSSQELRGEVEAARERLAGTVGEIGGVVDETRTEVVRKGRAALPYVAGVIGSYVIFKVFRKARQRN